MKKPLSKDEKFLSLIQLREVDEKILQQIEQIVSNLPFGKQKTWIKRPTKNEDKIKHTYFSLVAYPAGFWR